MSLFGWVGGRLMARIEAMPSVKAQTERAERTAPVVRAANSVASRVVDDAAAKQQLIEKLTGKNAEILEVLKDSTFTGRDDYVRDRFYRLLSAIASDCDVEPTPAWRAKLFGEEEQLGRMPIEQAFQHLAGIEPRLLSVEHMARSPGYQLEKHDLPEPMRRALTPLVGAGAENDNELLRSNLATSICHQYLLILLGEERLGPPETPYFSAPRQIHVASVVVGRGDRAGERGDT